MYRVGTSRFSMLVGAAIVVAVAACSDDAATQPQLGGPGSTALQGSGGPSDTAGHGNGGGGGTGGADTGVSHRPPPQPVQRFALTVHVGAAPFVTNGDTTFSTPAVGVPVTIASVVYTPHPGATSGDTLSVTETPIGSATTDSQGDVNFPGLDGNLNYIVRANPSAASGLLPASFPLYKAYSEAIRVQMTLARK